MKPSGAFPPFYELLDCDKAWLSGFMSAPLEQFDLEGVGFYPAHREIGCALVVRPIERRGCGPTVWPRHQRRRPMELLLIIVVIVLLFGGGGYWGRRQGHW